MRIKRSLTSAKAARRRRNKKQPYRAFSQWVKNWRRWKMKDDFVVCEQCEHLAAKSWQREFIKAERAFFGMRDENGERLFE